MRKRIAVCLALFLAGCSPKAVEEAVTSAVNSPTEETTDNPEDGAPNAVDAMSAILAQNPTDEAALVQRGNELFKGGAIDEAIQDYTAALVLKDSARPITIAPSLTQPRTPSRKRSTITR